MLKILHIIPNLLKGGAQRIAIDICNELSHRSNIEVTLLYFSGDNEFEFLTKNLNLKKINVDFNLSLTSKNKIDIQEYEDFVDEFNPNIIHSHLYFAELISREQPRPEIKYFTHCHDNMRQLNKLNISVFKNKMQFVEYFERIRLLKKFKKSNTIFLAISQDGFKFLKSNLPSYFSRKIILLSNAINTANFSIERPTLKSKKENKLINIGNFIPKKNQMFLVDVMKELQNLKNNYVLTFVGEGETKAKVEQKVKSLKLENSIDFVGKKDDVRKLLSESDLYVHSALYEPFGLVLLEAMASGLPIITLDGRGNRDIIEDGSNGFIIPQGNVKLFVERILEFENNKELSTKIRNEGFKTAQQHDIKPYCDKLIEIYLLNTNINAL